MFTKLTPAEKAAKEQRRAEERAQRAALRAEQERHEAARAKARETARKERMEAMPEFVVREVREVRVKAEDMQDAIALAACAFREGQSSDHTIKWHRPFGVEGDTIEPIRVVNVKAVED